MAEEVAEEEDSELNYNLTLISFQARDDVFVQRNGWLLPPQINGRETTSEEIVLTHREEFDRLLWHYDQF